MRQDIGEQIDRFLPASFSSAVARDRSLNEIGQTLAGKNDQIFDRLSALKTGAPDGQDWLRGVTATRKMMLAATLVGLLPAQDRSRHRAEIVDVVKSLIDQFHAGDSRNGRQFAAESVKCLSQTGPLAFTYRGLSYNGGPDGDGEVVSVLGSDLSGHGVFKSGLADDFSAGATLTPGKTDIASRLHALYDLKAAAPSARAVAGAGVRIRNSTPYAAP